MVIFQIYNILSKKFKEILRRFLSGLTHGLTGKAKTRLINNYFLFSFY